MFRASVVLWNTFAIFRRETEQLRRSSNTQHHFLPILKKNKARSLLHCYAYTFVCLPFYVFVPGNRKKGKVLISTHIFYYYIKNI